MIQPDMAESKWICSYIDIHFLSLNTLLVRRSRYSHNVVERTLAEAMTLADRIVFSALTVPLESQHKTVLDSLLSSGDEQLSRLKWLLQPPGKINGKSLVIKRHLVLTEYVI